MGPLGEAEVPEREGDHKLMRVSPRDRRLASPSRRLLSSTPKFVRTA